MNTQVTQTPYELLGGEERVRELAHTFYDVMDELPQAAVIREMHSRSLDDIKERLFEYLSGCLCGPPLYQVKYGTICLTSPHKKYAIGESERDQWLLCMSEALERIGAPDDVKQMLRQPMYAVTNLLRTQ